MKKIQLMLIALLLVAVLAGCSQPQTPETTVSVGTTVPTGETLPMETAGQPETVSPGETTVPETEPLSKGTVDYSVRNLSPEAPLGIGALLVYVDEHFIVFQSDPGLFGYDLQKREIVFSFDLQKAVGTTAYEGDQEGAVVHVSSDGTCAEVYGSFNNERENQVGEVGYFYIDTSDGSYIRKDTRTPLTDFFDITWYEFEAEYSMGNMNPDGPEGDMGTAKDLKFVRGDEVWYVLEDVIASDE